MEPDIRGYNKQFLKEGGEMAKLILDCDWLKTDAGLPKQWPQGLRTTLGFVLNSNLPMFLFWGHELRCFYNDAFIPSLAHNGTHPLALGKPGVKMWPEIWHIIKPLIDKVIDNGEASLLKGQLIHIQTN